MYCVSLVYDAYGLDGYDQYGLEDHTVTSFQESKDKCLLEIKEAIIKKFGVYDENRIYDQEERELLFSTEILDNPVKDF